MDKLFSYSDYDVFAYITSGFVFLTLMDFAFTIKIIVDADWHLSTGFAVVFFSYIAGHVIASFSSIIFEQLFVKRILAPPLKAMMVGHECFITRQLFRGYFKLLPNKIKSIIDNFIKENGMRDDFNALFLSLYPMAQKDPISASRIETFLKLYGFSRNISFSFCSAAILYCFFPNKEMPIGNFQVSFPTLGILLGLLGILFFYRYLKFYRHFSMELIYSFIRSIHK